MFKKNSIFSVGLVLTFAFITISSSGCKHLQNYLQSQKPKVKFKRLELKKISFEGLDVDFLFEISNPIPLGIKFSSLEYQLDVEGSTLFKGTQPKGIEIKAEGKSPLRLPFGITFRKLVNSLVQLFQQKERISYRIALKLGFQLPIGGEVIVPIQKEGTLPVPKLPSIRPIAVKLASLSMTGAKLEFKFSLKNPNDFPIQLRGLAYNFDISNFNIAKGRSEVGRLIRGERKIITLPLAINFLSSGLALANTLRSGKILYNFSGYLDFGLFKYPFKFRKNQSLR